MMVERMLYRSRQINELQSVTKSIFGKHALLIKIFIHFTLVMFVHIELGFVIAKRDQMTEGKKLAMIIVYFLSVLYFVFSALQIRYGYP